MCIISSEKRNSKPISLLLDGRQRRNALSQMYDDPEKIYLWAVKFVGIKNNDQPADLEDKFEAKIHDYIEAEYDDQSTSVDDSGSESDVDNGDVVLEEISGEEDDFFDPNESGLKILLQIIKICHNKYSKGTGFTRPFDLSKYVNRLP